MPYLHYDKNIQDRRINLALKTLRDVLNDLREIEESTASLFDRDEVMNDIYELAIEDGEPILPLGILDPDNEEMELVLKWDGIKFNWESDSKFIDPVYDDVEGSIVVLLLNILEKGYEDSNVDERYEYDYASWEVLNEVYRATFLLYKSIRELFMYQYEEMTLEEFLANNDYDDSGRPESILKVFDTTKIDLDLDENIYPIIERITDIDDREMVKDIYDGIRDQIKFYCTFDIIETLERSYERLLFVINGLKKFDIGPNITMQDDEEVFFPMHNKPVLDNITMGGAFRF